MSTKTKKIAKKARKIAKKVTTGKKAIHRGTRKKKSKFNIAGHRSGLETTVADFLDANLIKYQYEGKHLSYTIPAKPRKYTPDFWLDDKTFIEVKGKLDLATRKKMEQVRAEHPGMRMIFVFGRPQNLLYKGSKTTYADWADKNGFEWYGVEALEMMEKL